MAKKAAARGLKVKPWVKTSLAPGSRVVSEYLDKAGLTPGLDALGFQVVGYGCTTCIGNSGPLAGVIDAAIDDGGLVVSSVLSGNRNFEGRVHAKVRSNYLASPPLVVAYALAGNVDMDIRILLEPYKESRFNPPTLFPIPDRWSVRSALPLACLIEPQKRVRKGR